ncbi:MAG TPA: T9SS type A sorting domain-containing protein [Candidatus Kapabacteria bacterium]|nr:T9SS type A sorting domain-containing protein [Candidatus Kapabacteria bacterium]
MKRVCVVFLALAAIILSVHTASAQKPAAATDFTVTDCDGTEHHLFTELDNNHVVVMEFVMGCLPCVQGRSAINKVAQGYALSNPGQLQTYTFGFSSNVDCSSIQSWMTDNNFTGTTFAGNDDINTSYGAAGGMPTIVVVGGTNHKVLYWKKGFANKDTTAIKAAISQVLGSQASVASSNDNESLKVNPNPAASKATLTIDCLKSDSREIGLYNSAGILLLSIYTGNLTEGTHAIDFSTEAIVSGMYYIRVTTAGKTTVLPLTIVH